MKFIVLELIILLSYIIRSNIAKYVLIYLGTKASIFDVGKCSHNMQYFLKTGKGAWVDAMKILFLPIKLVCFYVLLAHHNSHLTKIMSELIHCSLNVFQQNLENPYFSEFDLPLARDIHKFHQTIPDYEKTPLVDLKTSAQKIGVEKIWTKDESKRFGLNAYKFLGVSYSIAKALLAPNEGIFKKDKNYTTYF